MNRNAIGLSVVVSALLLSACGGGGGGGSKAEPTSEFDQAANLAKAAGEVAKQGLVSNSINSAAALPAFKGANPALQKSTVQPSFSTGLLAAVPLSAVARETMAPESQVGECGGSITTEGSIQYDDVNGYRFR